MINLDQGRSMRDKLGILDEQGKPIRVGIIGCGRFGSMMLAQIRRAPGMDVSVACDLRETRAIGGLEEAGYTGEEYVHVSSVSGTNDANASGLVAITDDTDVVVDADIDVVIEATGNPDAGASHAYKAIRTGKHVVMVNVESDVLAGPILKRMADKSGVVYSLAYGDQPAVIEGLYDWAISMGFDVVAAGKGTRFVPEYRKMTPDDALIRYGYSEEEATAGNLNPQMYNSFLDGTKAAVEMCSVANMTGLVPDIPGMHFPPASIKEVPRLLVPREEGGILGCKGVVDIVSDLRPDGSIVPDSLRWGVFVVITTDSAYLRRCMDEYGMAMDSSGKYGLMYRPYHLVGMETPMSIAKLFLYGEPTGAPVTHAGEVVAVARRALRSGEVLDGEGGYTVYGLLVRAEQAKSEGLLPIGLSHGATMTHPVSGDTMVRLGDVGLPKNGFMSHLRELQDAIQ